MKEAPNRPNQDGPMPDAPADDRGTFMAATPALLASIIEHNSDAIIGKTLTGTVTAWNRAAERLFGYATGEIIGQDVRVLIPRRRWPEEDAALQAVRAGEPVPNYDSQRLTFSGRLFDVAVTMSPILSGCGRVIGASTTVRDVTRQKAVTDAISASATRFRQLADTLPEIVWESDAAGRTVYYNYRWYELTGMSVAQALADGKKAWHAAVHPDDLERVVARWVTALETGKPLLSEGRLLDAASGRYRWHIIRATPIAGPGGRTLRWFGTASDVDDLRHAEAERQRMERQAVEHQATLAHLERVRSMGQMATGLAHELNQPLGAIMNYGAALRSMIDRDAPATTGVDPRTVLDDIMDQANRAGEIIRRLRTFVKNRRPQTRLQPLGPVVREAVALMAFDFRQAGVTVALDWPDGLPEVDIDAVQIQQVLVNLMRNAVEAMHQTPAAERSLVVSAAVRDDAVVVSVADRGCGLPVENAGRIFASFFTTKPDGLGIGLALCRTILEEHGGTVWANGRPDGGSVFSFRLPPARPQDDGAGHELQGKHDD